MLPFEIALHVLASVVWVGGMFFAYMALRPVAATLLEPPQRLPLWSQTFAKFFPWVWVSVVLLPLTGYGMLMFRFGGLAGAPGYVNLMQLIGWVMIVVYLIVFFLPYQQLRKHVAVRDFPAAGKALARIRQLIALNLTLGLITVAIATGGRYFI